MTATALPAATNVAIVGAGPTGLALAVTLAQAGIDFVLLDRQAEGANTSRAAVVHARTLEVMEELGAAEQMIARGRKLTHFSVRENGHRLLAIDFAGLPTRYPYTLLTPQYETESVLLARLRELGGDVHRPYELTSVQQDEDGVTLTMAGGEQLRAAYAVGADGMHSLVREEAGIGFTGGSYAESFVLADVTMDWVPGPDEVSLSFGRDGLFVVAPFSDGRYRVVATVAEAPAEPSPAFVQQLLDGRAPGQAQVHEVHWSSRFRVHHRVADRYRAGRLFLAGDAAHVHSPAGGQGMNTGIQDGFALGRAFASGSLDQYEARRRPVALEVVAFTDRMTRIATATGPTRLLRNAMLPLLGRLPAFRRTLATNLAELRYR